MTAPPNQMDERVYDELILLSAAALLLRQRAGTHDAPEHRHHPRGYAERAALHAAEEIEYYLRLTLDPAMVADLAASHGKENR